MTDARWTGLTHPARKQNVGLTLTAAPARKGHTVYGLDTQPTVLDPLARGQPHGTAPFW
ncbi:hypothetical protein [Phytohabitans rumicis]|uniref:Uncharacterized protein n=1 Tax=Phytohabitans rumicis TaxID=1076125 RepID=A0A6V8LRR9_9ACTN|nr:hypothetical protein [Phytohabitans rumicis]GFJ95445.1 hypothetical protein Prum_090870 [Phytohabitans rumicis]